MSGDISAASDSSAADDGNMDTACLNCGTLLTGMHCHHCGQKADIHRSFGAIGHELAHGIFHFDGKVWATLPLLLWRPGALTRRYIDGERAKFLSPMTLFLFTVFLTFAIMSILDSGERAAGQTGIVDISASLSEQDNAPHTTPTVSTDFASFSITPGIPFIDHGIEKFRENPSLMLYKLQADAYKFAWALIPLSMPFMWLLYPFNRRFHFYDHFVFITFSISAMLLLFVCVRLINLTIFGEIAAIVALLFIPFHIYRQLRGTYLSTALGTAVRTVALLIFCITTIIIFALMLLAMGLMG